MIKFHLLFWAGLLGSFGISQADEPEARMPKKHFALFEAYCLGCHDTETQKGGLDLETLSFQITSIDQADLWQNVLNAMNSGEMPPKNKRQPKNAEKADFLDDLAQTMVLARKKLSDSGGKITMRRLNRREYHNTIEALTGVNLNVETLPSDEGSGTFDTVGASQYISSDQFEQYLELGRRAIDDAFQRQATQKQPSRVFHVEPENTVNVKNLEIITRLEDTYKEKWLPWKEGVDKAAEAPENQGIVAALRKQHPDYDSDPVLKYKKAGLLKGAPDPRDYGGSDPINAVAALYSPYRRYHSYMKHYAELPHNDRGAYLQLSRGIQRFDVHPDPKDVPSGTYKLRIRVGAVKGSDPSRHFIEIGHPQKLNGTSPGFTKLLSTQPISGTIENPEIIEVNVEFGERTPRAVGIQERQPKSAKLVRKDFDRHKQKNGYGTPPAVWIDWIELEGPIREKQAPELTIARVEPEKTINPANEEFIKQVEERQERFKQWKKGVDEAAKSPENQAIIAEIRKTDRLIDHPNRFYGYAEHFKGAPDPSEFGFLDSKKAAASDPSRSRSLALHKHYASLPHRDTGTYLKLTHGTGRVIVPRKKKELQPGNYVVRVRVGAVKGTPASRRFIEVGHPQRDIDSRNWGLKGRPIGVRQVTGTIEAPQIIEFPIELSSGMPQEFAVQEKQPNTGNLKVLWDDHNKLVKENGYGHPPAIWIDWVELEGPLNPKQQKTWKQRRQVEVMANAKVKRKYENYFKAGYDAARAFQKDGIPRPEVGVKDEHEAKFRIRRYEMEAPSQLRYLNDPLTKNGSLLGVHDRNGNLNSQEIIELKPDLPAGSKKADSLPAGKYRIRFRIGSIEGTSPDRHFAVLGSVESSALGQGDEFSLLETFQVPGTTDAPVVFQATVELTLNGPRKFSLREKSNLRADAVRSKREIYKDGMAPPPALWVDWVEWEGPLAEQDQNAGLVSILTRHLNGSEESEEKRAREMFKQFCCRSLSSG